MEMLDKIGYSITNKPVGGFIGAISGYIFCTKIAKTSNLIVVVPTVVIFALLGSSIEYKLTEKQINKTNN